MPDNHETQIRVANTLMHVDPDEQVADQLYTNLYDIGYRLPLQSRGDVRHVISSMSDVIARERIAASYIPGSRTHWNLQMTSHLTDAALIRDDLLTAYACASFYDSLHPLRRITGQEYAQSRVLWAGYMAIMPDVGIDIDDYI